MKHHGLQLTLIAAAAAVITACGHGGGDTAKAPKAPDSSTAITIADFAFKPASIKVGRGTSVAVTNTDDVPHTVTADDGRSFDSGTMESGQSTTVRAPGPGTYAYHCVIHPYMKGSLAVN